MVNVYVFGNVTLVMQYTACMVKNQNFRMACPSIHIFKTHYCLTIENAYLTTSEITTLIYSILYKQL